MSNKITSTVFLEPNATAYYGILHISNIQNEDGSGVLVRGTHKGRFMDAQRLPSSIIYSIYPHKCRIRLHIPHEPILVLERICIHKCPSPQIDIPTPPSHTSQRLSRESTAYSTGHIPIASVVRYPTSPPSCHAH